MIVKREYVEIGPEGERVDVDDYQTNWEREIQSLVEINPLIKKIKEGQELTNEEVRELSEKLNSPDFYFNEANLKVAYHYPEGSLSEFVKAALKTYELPTEEKMQENKIDDLFEAWLIEGKFGSQQSKILRMVKSQYLANKEKIDVSIFNQPLFNQFGGLPAIIRIFG